MKALNALALIIGACFASHVDGLSLRGVLHPREIPSEELENAKALSQLSSTDVVEFVLHKCALLHTTRICDPEHMLSNKTMQLLEDHFQVLAIADPLHQRRGLVVNLVLLNIPGGMSKATLRAAGDALRNSTGAGSEVVVGVYSYRDAVFSLSAAPELMKVLPVPDVERSVEHAGIGTFCPNADEAAMGFYGTLSSIFRAVNTNATAGEGSWRLPQHLLEQAVKATVYFASICLGLFATMFVVCLAYDLVARWLQVERFHACLKKVQRVHEAVMNPKGEPPLCLCCVDTLKAESTASSVTFLCGHRFHIKCVNAWSAKATDRKGKCPVCEEQAWLKKWLCACAAASNDAAADEVCGAATPEAEAPLEVDTEVQDETKLFVLQSLRTQYPEIIPEVFVQKWATCHTEIWLQELKCPPRCLSILKALAAHVRE
mmetsp:Transcript_13497/g.31761  ORF Transcript_13497/g.31761 Transcript_13497/m.31761 type:complete len:431 (+) Transcript_13497:93-1385(+)